MNTGSTGLRKWTQRFTIASTGSFVATLLALLFGMDGVAVLIGVFGFVCPMVFGMAYLLLPSYVGKTLIDQRLAGIHFVVTYTGVSLLVLDRFVAGTDLLVPLGALCWTIGVLIFVGSLLATVGPALGTSAVERLRGRGEPQRSTRLATAAIPVAIGYLIVGTIAFLMTALPLQIGSATLPRVIHYYLVGFATLLIYALGARLLLAFFHVSLPRSVVWVVLVAGILTPVFLGTSLWIDPWFQVGAAFAAIAMLGYAGLVVLVTWRTDRIRVGLSGILLGAIAGGAAVMAALPVAFGSGTVSYITVHRTLILAGFFPLTIIGYAYLFFPVTGGQFAGANVRSARATIGFLGVGVALQAFSITTQYGSVRIIGTIASISGAVGYGYLLGRRFLSA